MSSPNSARPQRSVLAANRRTDGAVVFLDFEGDWSDNLATAVVARAPDERRALADRARYEAERALVVKPRLVEVDELDGRPIPIRRRAAEWAEGTGAFADPDGVRAGAPRCAGARRSFTRAAEDAAANSSSSRSRCA